jgi:hypothetical protein
MMTEALWWPLWSTLTDLRAWRAIWMKTDEWSGSGTVAWSKLKLKRSAVQGFEIKWIKFRGQIVKYFYLSFNLSHAVSPEHLFQRCA